MVSLLTRTEENHKISQSFSNFGSSKKKQDCLITDEFTKMVSVEQIGIYLLKIRSEGSFDTCIP
jgi:hypothetical protein